jgi:hypothetical protein
MLWASVEVDVYPGGRADSDDGYVAVELVNISNTGTKIQYNFSIRDVHDKEVVNFPLSTDEFSALGSQAPRYNAWCARNFSERSTIMNALVDGSLIIEVRLKSTTTDKSKTQFIPTNPFNRNVSELFNEEETADLVFEVGGQQQAKGKRKRAKTATTNFYAQRIILQKCAPTLYEMCGESDEGGITTVSITDVKPEIFNHMLYYAY